MATAEEDATRAPLAPTGAWARKTLRGIGEDLQAVADALLENGGDLTPELEAALLALEGEREVKVERIARLLRNMRAQAEVAKAEEAEQSALRVSWERAHDRLKDYLHREMRAEGFQLLRVKTGTVHVRRQRNSRPSFDVADPRKLPKELRWDPPLPDPVLNDSAALERWAAAFEDLVESRCALMTQDERRDYVLLHAQELAEEAGAFAFGDLDVRVTLSEHLRY